MEFSKTQIAALVLGYMKSEKLTNLANDFISTCPHFKNADIKIGRYYATRVGGMALVDFLKEYAVINTIIQSRLEETSYFETHSRTSLVDQLLFLLEKENSCTSTPSLSEVEATPAHSLPGNHNNLTDQKTPKAPRMTKEDVVDVTEVLTQSFLGHPELHEKLAETINMVRSTPEVITEECIGAEATKELDAVIKTVVQRTEEDPVYTKLLDEIIGSTPNESNKKLHPHNTRSIEKSKSPNSLETANAIRSILEQDSQHVNNENLQSSDVYVFDGTLDAYLKTTGATNQTTQNPLYVNTGSLIVVPPVVDNKQFYIVNNQPLVKMSNVLTENEIMSIPTVIVSEENQTNRSKSGKFVPIPSKNEAPRQASHVRNLDFSTPSRVGEKKKNNACWDSDLRELVQNCKDKSPSPKKKRGKKKKEPEIPIQQTPVKDVAPKTPVLPTDCTPFNDVIDEHLKDVDLNLIPTPCIPLTPGFALTPGQMLGYNKRATDYSTCSSYYLPSDTEKSMEQLLSESEKKSPVKENLKILSDVVIEKARPATNEVLKKFNNNVIGKKNLSLIRNDVVSSESSDNDGDGESVSATNQNERQIKEIIQTVEVKSTLNKSKKNLLTQLEEKRQRTIKKIKTTNEVQKVTKNRRRSTTTKRCRKKKVDEEDEAEKLVKGLAQRGIHLMKKAVKNVEVEEESDTVTFDRKVFDSCQSFVFDDKLSVRKIDSYDVDICKKSMSAKVFIDDIQEEVTRLIKWTECEEILDLTAPDEDLMDFALMGKSPRGKKRNRKSDGDATRKTEKRNKTCLQMLKKINVDDFLDKVHGE